MKTPELTGSGEAGIVDEFLRQLDLPPHERDLDPRMAEICWIADMLAMAGKVLRRRNDEPGGQ